MGTLPDAAPALPREGEFGAHNALVAPVRKGGPELGEGGEAGAVCGGEALNTQATKGGDGFLHALGAGRVQVHAAQDGVNWPAASEIADVFERVDHAGVGAAQEHHKALRAVEAQGLVIQERIGPGTGGVEKEAAAGIFKCVLTGNLSGDEDAVHNFRGFGGPDYAGGGLAEELSGCGIHPNGPAGAVGVAGELGGESGGMKKEPGFGCRCASRVQSSCVVVVAVAEDDRVGVCEVDPELGGVVKEQVALAGVEEEAARADLEMEGEAVFGAQSAGMDAILDQSGDCDWFFHFARRIWPKRWL